MIYHSITKEITLNDSQSEQTDFLSFLSIEKDVGKHDPEKS